MPGLPDQGLFSRWPPGVDWWRVTTTPAELRTFTFIPDEPWLKLSKGSRIVGDGAANVGTSAAPADLSEKIQRVSDRIREGHVFDELILVACRREGPIVVMEGHARATAYVYAGAPTSIECLLGISLGMDAWGWWGLPVS